jgi:integrase
VSDSPFGPTQIISQLEEQTRPYQNFIQSLKSDYTKRDYKKALFRYLAHYNTTLERMLSLQIDEVEERLIDYILFLKKDDLSTSFINLNFCALKHFYFMNNVRINKEKIGKFLGESKKKNVDRSYTHAEIKSILDIADLRFKVVISVLASTGIGPLPFLRLSHLVKKGDVYRFTIYQNTKDEYFCFCSTEAAGYIDSYLEYRTRSGEKLSKEDSFLIREQFDVNDIEQIRKQGRSITINSMSNILYSLAIKSGVRQTNHNSTGRERQAVPLAHGFRKFFTTQLINSKVNPEIREMLLGHSIGLAGAYYKPTEDEMLEEYMKAVDNLTINPENKLRKKVDVLQKRNDSLDRLLDRLDKLEKEIGIKI